MFKEMNKYFSGEYMKYWYVAFVVVVAVMLFSFYNSKSVYQFQLTTFDRQGNVIESKVIHEREFGMTENERLDYIVPIKETKTVVPLKKF